jgi:divalent metal cation (Fe/Co/Zn/Cd) transporter
MHFGPEQVLLNLDIEFRPDLSASQITAAVDRLEAGIRRERPSIKRIFIEAESLKGQAPESRRTN